MKQKLWTISIVLLFIGGLSLAMYPLVSEWINSNVQKQLIEAYENNVTESQSPDLSDEWENAQQYNKTLASGSVVLSEPFDDTKFVPSEENYKTLLNLDGSGVMGFIEIPQISVSHAIYHTVEDEILRTAAGHLPGTSLPVGGKGTHSVISSHRGVASAKLFTDLDKIEMGDVFYIHVLDEVLAYKVDEINVVEPEDVSKLAIDKEKDYVTLVTCTPYSVNTHRLLVRGVRTEYIPLEDGEEVVSRGLPYGWQSWGIFLPAVAGLIVLLILTKKDKNPKQQ